MIKGLITVIERNSHEFMRENNNIPVDKTTHISN